MHRAFALTLTVTTLLLAGCVSTTTSPSPQSAPQTETVSRLSVSQANTRLAPIKARMEPVAERECRARTQGMNCDFLIQVHPDRNAPANAYQSLTESGQPTITFNAALVSDVHNNDELAFIMGHEAAHHIMLHISRQQSNALIGQAVGGLLASAVGLDASIVDLAAGVGGSIGARAYSKNHELEADRLGTVITHRSGYNPVRGAEYFTRIPDPGNQFLGTHPPNTQRIAIVKQTAAGL